MDNINKSHHFNIPVNSFPLCYALSWLSTVGWFPCSFWGRNSDLLTVVFNCYCSQESIALLYITWTRWCCQQPAAHTRTWTIFHSYHQYWDIWKACGSSRIIPRNETWNTNRTSQSREVNFHLFGFHRWEWKVSKALSPKVRLQRKTVFCMEHLEFSTKYMMQSATFSCSAHDFFKMLLFVCLFLSTDLYLLHRSGKCHSSYQSQ